MKTPSFPYPGGKVKIRNKILGLMPLYGRKYVELFAGLGNMFYLVKQYLKYEQWELNDVDMRFFKVLKTIDLNRLENGLDQDDFDYLSKNNSELSILLEPRISFGGKGYKSGINLNTYESDYFIGDNYKKNCLIARELLTNVKLIQGNYKYYDLDTLEKGDLLYLDPPYLGTKVTTYANIDHEDLIDRINGVKCKWLISGYDNDLYNQRLRFKNKFEIDKYVTLNHNERNKVKEIIWRNY